MSIPNPSSHTSITTAGMAEQKPLVRKLTWVMG